MDERLQVFISYRHKSQADRAAHIHTCLHHRGYKAFLDARSSEETDLSEELAAQVRESRDVIVLLSDGVPELQSKWMREEVENAIDANANIVLVCDPDVVAPEHWARGFLEPLAHKRAIPFYQRRNMLDEIYRLLKAPHMYSNWTIVDRPYPASLPVRMFLAVIILALGLLAWSFLSRSGLEGFVRISIVCICIIGFVWFLLNHTWRKDWTGYFVGHRIVAQNRGFTCRLLVDGEVKRKPGLAPNPLEKRLEYEMTDRGEKLNIVADFRFSLFESKAEILVNGRRVAGESPNAVHSDGQ